MLKSLDLTNFKAWRELQIALGKVTGLFGTNSSGKSSLLQFLLLLKQTKNATDRGLVLDFGGPTNLVNLGNYEALVHQGNLALYIDWTLDWMLPKPLRVNDPSGSRNEVRFTGHSLQESSRVEWKGSHPSARYVKYRFDDTVFAIEPRADESSKFELRSEGPPTAIVRSESRTRLGIARPGQDSPFPRSGPYLLSKHGLSKSVRSRVRSFDGQDILSWSSPGASAARVPLVRGQTH